MRHLLTLSLLLCLFALASCRKSDALVKAQFSSSSILVPGGFHWQNSRNIGITVNNTDTRFGGIMHQVALYNGDPAQNGKLLATGSATNTSPFVSRIYLPFTVSSIYIVKTAPDNSISMLIVTLNGISITTSIGQ